MIRQDYFMRMVQELLQTLQRVEFLRKRQDLDAALLEIDRTLARFWDLSPEQVRGLTLEDWIALAAQEGGVVGQKLVVLGDVFKADGELQALKGQLPEGERSYAMALGLYLESLQTSMVSVELLEKTEDLIEVTRNSQRPVVVTKRLLAYLEARGRYARAEDVLYEWRETGDSEATQAALEFYERLLAKSDQELAAGDLPRAEVEEGRQQLQGLSQT